MARMRQALVSSTLGRLVVASHVSIPAPEQGEMLCQTAAVGLNPGDVKFSDYTSLQGTIGGFDFAGVVLQVGPGVTRFKAGDRVAGFAHGYDSNNKSSGAFADVVLAVEDLTLKLPHDWTFEQGATLGTIVATAGMALSHYLDIPLPEADSERTNATGGKTSDQDGEYVLVSGAATATGMVATQLLRLAGFRPVGTCSPRSAELVRSLGAVATLDYRSPTCGADIRSLTGNSLTRVLDCVTSAETMAMCYSAIGSKGGRYVALDPVSTHVKYTRRDVSADWPMALAIFGHPVRLAGVYGRPATPALRGLGARIFCMAEALIERGELRGPPFQVRKGGLAAVDRGIEDLRKGRAKGEKLVYPLA
ncbi:GroES-like protein [Canariomyces notabilis]|uniref:GroES-like protein n=1 Tax=Canariomyces notabilis TaxID=2074819 RepID=A0AAN6QHB5_9PEZI|nr:GroES-like protein [Canariomyces arenarius]